MTVEASGTQTCVIGTEHTLTTKTTAATYVAKLNFKNAVDLDEFEIRVLVKVLSGDSTHFLEWFANYLHKFGDGADVGAGASGCVVVSLPATVSPYSIVVTLKQIAGTGRAVPWAVMSL
jgi:hypothetical protein